MLATVYIGIGSNLNQPEQQVKQAIISLSDLTDSSLIAESSLYLSPPMGLQNQDHYINAVVKLKTQLSPITLLDQLQSIEKSQGRVRKTERWSARTLDLDLLLYGQQLIDQPRLKVPHYGMKRRDFVLIPLAEIEPELILPDNSRLTDLIEQLAKSSVTRSSASVPRSAKQGIQKL